MDLQNKLIIYGLRRSQNLKNNIKKYIKEIKIEK